MPLIVSLVMTIRCHYNLPEFYYKMDGNDKVSDFTASLTISRLKFSIGLSGAISFKINAMGSEEWVRYTTSY